jgi:1,4-alpha-glucan branching enzyme
MRSIFTSAGVLAALVSVSCAGTAIGSRAPISTPAGVRFVLEYPSARTVAVAGSFNEWSAVSHPLARDASPGIWTGLLRLPPGEHRFMYVVDGTLWVSPPFAEDYADDGFGSKNGVVVVRPADR